jgi:hypothetical protein
MFGEVGWPVSSKPQSLDPEPLVAGVVLIPMSLMTLEENVTIQWASFVIMTIITLEFLWQFNSQGLDNFDVCQP